MLFLQSLWNSNNDNVGSADVTTLQKPWIHNHP